VGLSPVVHGLEPFPLVTRELQVDLGGGDDAKLGQLDDRNGLVVEAEQDALVAGSSERLVVSVLGETGGRGLVAPQNGVDELPSELRPRPPELQRS
jgi:hypothetical protein